MYDMSKTDFSKFAVYSPISNGALLSTDLPSNLKVLNFGDNKALDGNILVNQKTLKTLPKKQKETGGDRIQIDFNHNTVPGTEAYNADKEPRAIAGYGTPVIHSDGSIHLENITWTDSGKSYGKQYQDLSPAVFLDEDGVVTGLHSVALCPKGAIEGLTFYSADKILQAMSSNVINDKEALKEMKDLEEHEKAELEGRYDETHVHSNNSDESDDGDEEDPQDEMRDKMYDEHYGSTEHHGADIHWTSAEHAAHADKVKEFDSDDHYSKYGDVKYGDTEHHKYPIDTEKHVRAAWSYINMPKNAAKYDSKTLSKIKSRIKGAMKSHDVAISEDKTKAMSADLRSPNAYQNTEPQTTTQAKRNMTEMFKALAPNKLGDKSEAEILEILKQLVAKWVGEDGVDGPITPKAENQVHEFSAKLAELTDKIQTLETKNAEVAAQSVAVEKANIIASATRDGKVLPSDKIIKALSVEDLKELVTSLPKIVPTRSNMKVLSTDGTQPKATRADAVRLLNEHFATVSGGKTRF